MFVSTVTDVKARQDAERPTTTPNLVQRIMCKYREVVCFSDMASITKFNNKRIAIVHFS
jgi:hypothetical protein